MAEVTQVPYDALSRDTITQHQAIGSLMEELEALDVYCQRAGDCSDSQLKTILLHTMREEIKHAAVLLDWLSRNNADVAGHLATATEGIRRGSALRRFTVGPMKE